MLPIKANRRLGIIQPGRIGDVLILAPIAKRYSDLGYQVLWPLHKPYVSMLQAALPYITFLPIDDLNTRTAQAELRLYQCCITLDMSFGFGPELMYNEFKTSNMAFDRFKYYQLNEPFEQRYNLSIWRNADREQQLYDKLVKNPKYVVIHNEGSIQSLDIQPKVAADTQVLRIERQADSIFDWLKIVEGATELHLIDSCILNLCFGLGIGAGKGTCYQRAANASEEGNNATCPDGWKIVSRYK